MYTASAFRWNRYPFISFRYFLVTLLASEYGSAQPEFINLEALCAYANYLMIIENGWPQSLSIHQKQVFVITEDVWLFSFGRSVFLSLFWYTANTDTKYKQSEIAWASSLSSIALIHSNSLNRKWS